MHVRKTAKRAFTLVEILIVVVILGILAAIVVPQFSKAADDARAGNIATQLSTIQNAIELYRAREGAYPDMSTWDDLMGGAVNTTTWVVTPAAGEDQYLKEVPNNPAAGTSGRALGAPAAGATGAANAGWVYDNVENQIYASYYIEDINDADAGTIGANATD